MGNKEYSQCFIEVLKSILSCYSDLPIKVCLNCAKKCNCIITEENLNLSVDGNTDLTASTESIPIELIVNGSATGNITVTINQDVEIPRLKVKGNTSESTVDVPFKLDGSSVNLDVVASADVSIPELDIICLSGDEKSECSLCDQMDDCCEFYCHTNETTIKDISIQGKATNTESLNGIIQLTIPKLELDAHTVKKTVTLSLTGTADAVEIEVSGSATGTINPIEISGIANTNGLPVTGTIDIVSECTMIPVCYYGILKKIGCGIIVLIDNESGKELVLTIDSILEIQFESIVEFNRWISTEESCKGYCDLETSLIYVWKKGETIELIPSNIGEGIEPIDSKDFAYIGYNILITSKKYEMYYNNSIINLSNIAGYYIV